MGERAHRRGAWHRCRLPFFSGDEVAARSFRPRYRRRGRGEEKEEMNLGFRDRGWPGGFVRAKRAGSRRMEMDGHGRLGQRRSPGGIGHKAEIPAQAQVAAWARGGERARLGAGLR